MKDLQIERIEVYAVGPETERYAWALGMDEQFMTNVIVRVTTKSGLEGVAGAAAWSERGFDRGVAETIRPLLHPLIGRDARDVEAIWAAMRNRNVPLAPQAQSIVDIALWDLAAKAAGMPLYRMLGGARDKVLSYASTPLLPDIASYLDFVADLADQGFRAVKFHCWCDLERDLALIRAAHDRFAGSGLTFMLDVEMRYTREQALRMAKELEARGFAWFEAPLLDTDLEGYAELRRRTTVPIIPAGNWILDPLLIAHAIRMGCWDSARVDATIVGGITPARKVMGLAEANGITVEVQCWGYTLTQAANLHLMLAHPNCGYFEQPVPYPSFEHGTLDPIRTDAEGYVHAPPGDGLGIRLDWPAIEAATFHRFACTG